MDSYLIGIGKKIRTIRKEKNLYASEIAKRANVSNGLISRIENGRTIPSVPVLLSIINALEIEPSDFFENIGKGKDQKFYVIRNSELETVEREDEAVGFTYHSLFSNEKDFIGFETVLLTLAPDCKRETVETDAFEFKYIIRGRCDYIIDGESVTLNEGDSIFFDGRLAHVPKNPYGLECLMIAFYLYS
ncbi:MAG: XRE family transcriptional regulator [Balneolaceae bacterium]|nr:MAG: XRE family transcriptional regulator [Balneolaceae bacterium]